MLILIVTTLIAYHPNCGKRCVPDTPQILRMPHLLKQMVLEKLDVTYVGWNFALKGAPCSFYIFCVVDFFIHKSALVVHCNMIIVTLGSINYMVVGRETFRNDFSSWSDKSATKVSNTKIIHVCILCIRICICIRIAEM